MVNSNKCHKKLSVLDAFQSMQDFLEKYFGQTPSGDIACLLSDIQFFQNKRTADPAAWVDWCESVVKVKLRKQVTTFCETRKQANSQTFLTAMEAFRAMQDFLKGYYERTSSEDVAYILEDIQIVQDGSTADPAAWSRWCESIEKVMQAVE